MSNKQCKFTSQGTRKKNKLSPQLAEGGQFQNQSRN